MDNILLDGWRLRVLDSNGEPFSQGARISFFESNLTTPKDVYGDIDSTISLGSVVYLDAEGYVPNLGVWLAEGAYSAIVETFLYTPPVGDDVYKTEWSIPYISGSDGYGAGESGGITFYPTVTAMTASETQENAYCAGYYNTTDGGGGHFIWDPTSELSEDLGSVLESTQTAVGRYIRIFENEYNIRQWSVTPDIVNSSVQIQRALTYANLNDISMNFPSGVYNTVSEDIDITERAIVEEGFQLNGDGTHTFDGCIINSNSTLSNTPTQLYFANIEGVKPNWADATTASTRFVKAVTIANNSNLPLIIDEEITLDAIVDFGIVQNGTLFKRNGKLVLSAIGSLDLGEISVEDDGMRDIITASSYDNFVPSGEYYAKWFQNFDQSVLEEMYNDRTYKGTMIHTEALTVTDYVEEATGLKHIFKHSSDLIAAGSSNTFSQTVYLNGNTMTSLLSLTTITSPIVIVDADRTLSVDTDFDSSNITFRHCTITNSSATNVIISGKRITFENCTFETSSGSNYDVSFATTEHLTIERCLFDKCNFLATNYPGRVTINPMTLTNSRFGADSTITGQATGCIKIVAGANDTIVRGFSATNNKFSGQLPDALLTGNNRIFSSAGSFSFYTPTTAGQNASFAKDSQHDIVIVDNTTTVRPNDFDEIQTLASTHNTFIVKRSDASGTADSFFDNQDDNIVILFPTSQEWRIGLFVLDGNDTAPVLCSSPYFQGTTWTGTLAAKVHQATTFISCDVVNTLGADVPAVDRWNYGFVRVKDLDEGLRINRPALPANISGRDGSSIALTIESKIYGSFN